MADYLNKIDVMDNITAVATDLKGMEAALINMAEADHIYDLSNQLLMFAHLLNVDVEKILGIENCCEETSL